MLPQDSAYEHPLGFDPPFYILMAQCIRDMKQDIWEWKGVLLAMHRGKEQKIESCVSAPTEETQKTHQQGLAARRSPILLSSSH